MIEVTVEEQLLAQVEQWRATAEQTQMQAVTLRIQLRRANRQIVELTEAIQAMRDGESSRKAKPDDPTC